MKVLLNLNIQDGHATKLENDTTDNDKTYDNYYKVSFSGDHQYSISMIYANSQMEAIVKAKNQIEEVLNSFDASLAV